ncbi:MAG TPA: transposase, partial [Ktedonobacterales bacterium]
LQAKAQTAGQALSAMERERLDLLVSRRVQRYLDAGTGACHLAKPAVAEIVAGALRHFDGQRYHLYAWCLMPNHVHVVMQPLAPHTLAAILQSWKSFTSKQVQPLLKSEGPFWRREYYDHVIRNEEALWRIITYVAENPLKVSLLDWPWVWVGIPQDERL